MGKTSTPVIGFFREKLDTEEFVFKAPQYRQAYHEIIDQLNEKGAYVAILMGNGTYEGNGRFSKHWVQVNDGKSYRFEKRGPITVDMLYVKDYFYHNDNLLQINTMKFREQCSDKHAAYELLHEFHPKSITINNLSELPVATESISGEMIAIKILLGNSGSGVFVGKKADFDVKTFNSPLPWQIQEYIETAAGIPGITDKRHDLRVIITNGEAIIATLRTPPEGGLKSNISYGGEARLIATEKIPSELLKICKKIDQKLAPLGKERHYSADFGLTPTGWKLFEVNAMPGTINRARGPEALYYQNKLTDFLLTAARSGQGGRQ